MRRNGALAGTVHKSSASQQGRRNDRCKKASPDLFSVDRFLSTSYTVRGAINFGASTLVTSGLGRARSPTWPFPLRSRFRCWCASSQRFSGGPALTVCRARKSMAIFAGILRHGFLMPHDHEARQSAGAHRMVFADLDPAAVTIAGDAVRRQTAEPPIAQACCERAANGLQTGRSHTRHRRECRYTAMAGFPALPMKCRISRPRYSSPELKCATIDVWLCPRN